MTGEGERVLSFQESERTKEKPIDCSPDNYLSSVFFRELYTGGYTAFLRRLSRSEPAAFAFLLVYGSRKL